MKVDCFDVWNCLDISLYFAICWQLFYFHGRFLHSSQMTVAEQKWLFTMVFTWFLKECFHFTSGITNTFGRILAGFLADLKHVNPLLLHNLALLAGGAACILNMFCVNYVLMCCFAAFFGLCVGELQSTELLYFD